MTRIAIAGSRARKESAASNPALPPPRTRMLRIAAMLLRSARRRKRERLGEPEVEADDLLALPEGELLRGALRALHDDRRQPLAARQSARQRCAQSSSQ